MAQGALASFPPADLVLRVVPRQLPGPYANREATKADQQLAHQRQRLLPRPTQAFHLSYLFPGDSFPKWLIFLATVLIV